MGDVLPALFFFGSGFGIVVAVLRYRYRVKLLAAATQSAGFAAAFNAHGAHGNQGAAAEVDSRIEELEEKLAWLERLAASGDAGTRARVSLPSAARGEAIAPPELERSSRAGSSLY